MRSSLLPEKGRLWLALSSSRSYTVADVNLGLAREIATMGTSLSAESIRLARKVSLLIHLLEEMRNLANRHAGKVESTSSAGSSLLSFMEDLKLALEAVKKFLLLSAWKNAGKSSNLDLVTKKLAIEYEYVTWQLEKVLGNISYEHFEISDEVQEEAELVLAQLRREIEKIGAENLIIFQEIYIMLSSENVKEFKQPRSFKLPAAEKDATCIVDSELRDMVIALAEVNGKYNYDTVKMTLKLMDRRKRTSHADLFKDVKTGIRSNNSESSAGDDKQRDSLEIPEDFLCPISLELMRNPVIVSTGQTYERSSIQRWIDCGHSTCPKTRQKLQNHTLTPNYVLRSLIMQWCEANKIQQPHKLANGHMRNAATLCTISKEISLINALVSKLSSRSRDEQRSAASELRSLSKRSTNNRKLIAEAGAIPALVSLLLVDDKKIQEHAVTSLLNLSIYDHNKEEIMLAGAILPVVHVLREGSMEARENASAAIFSLSLSDENKIIIGGTPGAIEALVELLDGGSARGKKDAATALFNLCIYQGNKSRAVRAGIVRPLLKMLRDSASSGMVDEVLTVLAVLVSHREGKVAMSKSNTIPVLIDILRNGQPRNKENATAILLALCKKDSENLARVGRMGSIIPLTEISRSGTERAKRKAASLLEHLQKLQIL
ncbi:U-box domain-containing protein 10-like [Phalaenopsis equestris]|uniref:U-box domain-containing protein 10-like n=1 Tax=Phalaenopsis equestris TaxID=78828 RepID=UPI0009E4B7AF|nr:U-box domain-containing protein 10-like [Phalaenopsis equestris]